MRLHSEFSRNERISVYGNSLPIFYVDYHSVLSPPRPGLMEILRRVIEARYENLVPLLPLSPTSGPGGEGRNN